MFSQLDVRDWPLADTSEQSMALLSSVFVFQVATRRPVVVLDSNSLTFCICISLYLHLYFKWQRIILYLYFIALIFLFVFKVATHPSVVVLDSNPPTCGFLSSIVVAFAQISFLLQLKLKVIAGWNPMCFINFVIVRNICVSFSTYGATWEEGPQRWVNGSMGQELQTELKYIFVNCACFE